MRDINLDYVVAHWDWNMAIPDRIRAKYGQRVEVRQWDSGSAHFVVEPRDPDLTCAQLQDEFGFGSAAERRYAGGLAPGPVGPQPRAPDRNRWNTSK